MSASTKSPTQGPDPKSPSWTTQAPDPKSPSWTVQDPDPKGLRLLIQVDPNVDSDVDVITDSEFPDLPENSGSDSEFSESDLSEFISISEELFDVPGNIMAACFCRSDTYLSNSRFCYCGGLQSDHEAPAI